MKISATNTEQEEAREDLQIEYAYEPLDVGFNVNYLLDVLSTLRTDEVRWSVHPDANASVLVTIPEHESFQYVVMPMRIEMPGGAASPRRTTNDCVSTPYDSGNGM